MVLAEGWVNPVIEDPDAEFDEDEENLPVVWPEGTEIGVVKKEMQ